MKAFKSKINFLRLAFATATVFFLSAGFTPDPLSINIDVAPNVLNIQSEGTVVTVHTDISYSAVNGASVLLNDVPIAWWKSDSRGQFVAKFNMEEVTELVDADVLELGDIMLTLTGSSVLGEFSGSQTIKVISVEAKGR
ncbi:hypothetical protein [Maribellus mangrovi]|uniref:hypothetical protein n=1 Tax=Maribellus mangrovi TaxID=3133146 RepID=UPI0030EE9613